MWKVIKAIFVAMTKFFGNIGNEKGFNNYLNPNNQNHINLKNKDIIEKFSGRINKLNSEK